MAPLIIENLANGFLTLGALLQPADLPLDRAAQFIRFFRVGVPVLLGLGQPTTSEALLDPDWLQRPASHLCGSRSRASAPGSRCCCLCTALVGCGATNNHLFSKRACVSCSWP